MSAAVIVDRQVAWHEVAGAASDTVFQAGSISKCVAACAALELVQRSEIDLDADVNETLVSWNLPGSRTVTLRQLLGHTAAVSVPFIPGYTQGSTLPEIRQILDGSPPANTQAVRVEQNRSGFCYSGGAYVVVQQLIADVTGVSFAEAAIELVLKPLGMSSSTFSEPLPDSLRGCAARHDWHVYPETAAAGLWTTANDLALFICALQSSIVGKPSPLRPATATWMLSPHHALPAKGEWNFLPLLGVRPPDTVGLGMFLRGSERFSHVGGAHSFFSMLSASLTEGTGGVVMVAANASPYPFRLLRAMSKQHGWSGFSVPLWRRPTGLPGLRHFA